MRKAGAPLLHFLKSALLGCSSERQFVQVTQGQAAFWLEPYREPVARRLLDRLAGEVAMLWTIAVILAVLWLLGVVSSYTFGGFLHLLLLLALVVVLINVIQGRRDI